MNTMNMVVDIIFCVILAVLSILLLTGHGKFILTSFRGRGNKGKPLAYDEKKLSITLGILCAIMLGAWLVFIFFTGTNPIPSIVAMIVVLISFVTAIIYLRKCAKVEVVEPPKK